MSNRIALAAVFTTLLTAPHAIAQDGGFEASQSIPLAEALDPARHGGPGFRVSDPALADGFSQHFDVGTDEFGEFSASSNYMLDVRIHEVGALQRLAEIRKSKAYAKAVGKAGIAPAYVVKDLVTRPVATVTAVPKGIWRSGVKAVRWIGGDRRERADTEDSATREALGVSRMKRELSNA